MEETVFYNVSLVRRISALRWIGKRRNDLGGEGGGGRGGVGTSTVYPTDERNSKLDTLL